MIITSTFSSDGLQELPLTERDRLLLRSIRDVGRGDGCVARVVGIGLLSLTVFMGWMCWQGLQRNRFDWGLLIVTGVVGLIGWFMVRMGTQKKDKANIFDALLEKGTKHVVKGKVENVNILANGALIYQIDGVRYDAHVLFLQPYPFVGILDQAHVLPSGNVALHLVAWAPGKYYRLQVEYNYPVERKQEINGGRFLPQRVRHNLMGTLLVSALVLVAAVVAESLMYHAHHAWFSNPELSAMFLFFTLAPALHALITYIRVRRRFRKVTVVRGKVSEVLVANALAGRMRVPHTWYTVGNEMLQVASNRPVYVGMEVQARYIVRGDGLFPLPISIVALS